MRLLAVALAIVVFVVHSSLFWGWIVDDAGISFAYARNLANGEGLVSQPGFEPVEGYSNPLWVGVLAPIFRLGLFDPLVTPKVLSIGLVAAAFCLLFETVRISLPEGRPRWLPLVPVLPLLLLALDSSFVIWTTSGLENPLAVFELSVMIYLTLRLVVAREFSLLIAAGLGLTAAAMTMTRPDGVLLGLALPALLPFVPSSWIVRARLSAAYAVGLLAPLSAFIAMRLAYFGDLYPNTYHAKGGLSTELLVPKAGDLLDSVIGFSQGGAQALLVLAAVAGIFMARRPALNVVGVFLACAAAGVLLLPQDWMRENRFCTLFAVCFYVVVTLEVAYLAQRFEARLPLPALGGAAVALVALVALSVGSFAGRSAAFADDPTVPLTEVQSYFGDRFEEYAEQAGVEMPSLLTLDIGGLLYYSVNLRVYDLVGLTDETIAKELHTDREAFHDYVLEDLKPTFIHTHGIYAVYAALDADPRFRKEYRPICERTDAWVERVWGFYWYSGDYVRWDVAPDDALVLEMAKACREELPYASN